MKRATSGRLWLLGPPASATAAIVVAAIAGAIVVVLAAGAAAATVDPGQSGRASVAQVEAAKHAIEDGVAALAAKPPERDRARRAFERAARDGVTDPTTAALALFQLAMLDEGELRFQAALEHYRRCADAAPGGRWGRIARGRAAWIEQRSEGGFAPLAALQGDRADPARRDDPTALTSLAQQAESFPPGLVRSEARIYVGEAWLKAPAHRAEGIAELRKAVNDPDGRASNARNLRYAERDLVEALLADQRLDEAASIVDAQPLDAKVTSEVRTSLRRRGRTRGALGIAGLGSLLAVAAGAWLLRRRTRRARLVAPRSVALLGRAARHRGGDGAGEHRAIEAADPGQQREVAGG